MPLTITFPTNTGRTLFATVERLSDGFFWDEITDQAFESAPSVADKKIALTEGSTENAGSYVGSASAGMGDAREVRIRIHDDDDSDIVIATGEAYILGGEEVANVDAISGSTSAADSVESNIGNLDSAISDVPTAGENADAVWDESTTGHTSAGTFGEQLKTDVDAILIDTAEIGSAGAGLSAVPWNSAWDAEVESEVTDALNAYDPPTKAELDSGLAGLNDLSTSDIDARLSAIGLDHLLAAQVVGADVADNSVFARFVSASATADWDDFANTTDSLQALRDRGDSAWITATGFATHSAGDVADAVLDEALSGHTASGSAGEALGRLDVAISTRSTVSAAQVNAECDTALSDYDAPTKAELDAGFAGLNDLSAAQVNAQVDTALADYDSPTKAELDSGLAALNDPSAVAIATAIAGQTLTESYAADGAAPTLQQALYMILQTVAEFSIAGTTITVKKLDGSTSAMTFTMDDATNPTSRTRVS